VGGANDSNYNTDKDEQESPFGNWDGAIFITSFYAEAKVCPFTSSAMVTMRGVHIDSFENCSMWTGSYRTILTTKLQV
jgi:hypothetical protein